MNLNNRLFAIFLIAAYALATGANAQNAKNADCPAPSDMKAEQLFGLWAVRFDKAPAGMSAKVSMLLERHAEFSDSLAGTVSRDLGPAKAALAGDLEDGMLLLDESSDNLSITGTWNAEMVAGSCGRLFQGHWKNTSSGAAENAPDQHFTLRKLP